MKNRILDFLVVAFLAVCFTGCVKTLDGRTKFAVPFKKDKITSSYERPVAQIFAAAKEVLSANGTLNREDTINKIVEGKVDTRTVWVKVQEVDPTITQVTVQVRNKNGGSDIDLAAEIDKQIALRLK
ncbi:MAG: DUF3568 family protein [Verrucomicrobiota bacterium]